MADADQKPRIVDNPDVPEIFANKTVGTSFIGGVINLTFGCIRAIPERLNTKPREGEPPPVFVTGRLALTQAAAVELANALNGILAEISKGHPDSPASQSNKPN